MLSCPNGSGHDTGTLTATGTATGTATAVSAAVLRTATTGYHDYVVAQSAKLLAGTKAFVAALDRGDLAAAKAQFGPVRAHYERIEPVAESFGNLDPADRRASQRRAGREALDRLPPDRADPLGAGHDEGDEAVRDAPPARRDDARHEGADADVPAGAARERRRRAAERGRELEDHGEEDRYSHTDLSDFEANVAGAREAFVLLQPALAERGDGALATDDRCALRGVERGLAPYRRTTPLGYALYGALTSRDRRSLAQAVDALAEPLSMVAAKVIA